jgi:hypothetical protein
MHQGFEAALQAEAVPAAQAALQRALVGWHSLYRAACSPTRDWAAKLDWLLGRGFSPAAFTIGRALLRPRGPLRHDLSGEGLVRRLRALASRGFALRSWAVGWLVFGGDEPAGLAYLLDAGAAPLGSEEARQVGLLRLPSRAERVQQAGCASPQCRG